MSVVNDISSYTRRLNATNQAEALKLLQVMAFAQEHASNAPKWELTPQAKEAMSESVDKWHAWKDEVEED